MTPSRAVNDRIGGVLARSLTLFKVEIFAFVFTSNHFHLLVRAHDGEMSRFMGYLQSNIAREVGRLVNWRGHFWERRFSAEPVLDDEAVLGRLKYIFAHGVKEGLVEKCRDWPGLTCLPELLSGARRLFSWVDRTTIGKLRRLGLSCRETDHSERYRLELAVLPQWRSLSQLERNQKAASLVAVAEHEGLQARAGKPALGALKVKSQDPHVRPRRLKRSNRPLCHASSRSMREWYRQTYRAFVSLYRQASELFRRGVLDVAFPRYAFRPPLPYLWLDLDVVSSAAA